MGIISGSSAPDPYFLTHNLPAGAYPANLPNYNLIGKTAVRLNGSANNGIIVAFGDSQCCNVAPTPYTPSNANVLNFNIMNGATYQAADPLLGCANANAPLGTGNMLSRLGDKIQGTGKFTNTIVVPAGIGGTTIAQWSTDQFNRIKATFARLQAAGVTATAVVIELGANDISTTQSAYATGQAAMIAIIRGLYAGPIFIATESWYAGTVNSAVQAAQAAAVDHANGIWAGANGDSLNASYRQVDNIHWNDTGADSVSSLWLSALQAYGAPFA